MYLRAALLLGCCITFGGCAGNDTLILDSTPDGRVDVEPHDSGGTDYSALADRSRSDWADVAPNTRLLDPMGTVTRMTVHHSGEVNDMTVDSDVRTHLRQLRTSQARSKSAGGLGAGDLSYHFIIDRRGVIWEGRYLRYQGAHAGNSTANKGNIGICLLGNFDVQYPNSKQTTALRTLTDKLMKRYNLSDRDIYTHKEIRRQYNLGATECPGKNLQPVVDSMRLSLRARR